MRSRDLDRLAITVLLLLPFLLLVISLYWTFLPPLGYLDPYKYTTHFRDLKADLPLGLYQGHRMPWNVIGSLVYSVASPEWANMFLRFALFYCSVIPLFIIVRCLWKNTLAAFVTVVLFAVHSYFLMAIRWDYVDGPIIASTLLMLACLSVARESKYWQFLLFAAGFLGMTTISLNLTAGLFLPLMLFALIGFSMPKLDRKRLIFSMGLMLIGALTSMAINGAIYASITDFGFNYLKIQYLIGSNVKLSEFKEGGWAWLEFATWLVFPAIVFVVSSVAAAITAIEWRKGRLSTGWLLTGLAAVQFIMACAIMTLFNFTYGTVLQYSFYTSYLLPYAFLALGGVLAQVLVETDWRRVLAISGGVLTVSLLTLLSGSLQLRPSCGMPARYPGLSDGFLLPVNNYPCGVYGPIMLLVIAVVVVLCAALVLRRLRVPLVLLAIVGLSVYNASGHIFFQIDKPDDKTMYERFLLVFDMDDGLRQYGDGGDVKYWYSRWDYLGGVFNGVSALRFSYPNILSEFFPSMKSSYLEGDTPIPFGQPIAILSQDPTAFQQAEAEFRAKGVTADLIATRKFERAGISATATIVRARPIGRDIPLPLPPGRVEILDKGVSKDITKLVAKPLPFAGIANVFIADSLPAGLPKADVHVQLQVKSGSIDICVTDPQGACLAQTSATPGMSDVFLTIDKLPLATYVIFRTDRLGLSGEFDLKNLSLLLKE